MRKAEIIVAGGGASGMTAAIAAARCGADVVILEKNNCLGRKILATGNGKCNLTNENMDISCYRSDTPNRILPVLQSFGYTDTLRFFEELGLCTKNKDGYIYPLSEQASAVAEVLRMEIRHLRIECHTETVIQDIRQSDDGFIVTTDKGRWQCQKLILATGGMASAQLGSDGSGYRFAKALGHRLADVTPALVQLRCKEKIYKQLAGVRTRATVTLYAEGRELGKDTGELQLTAYGISGIPVFQVSRYAAKALKNGQSVRAVIDFLPQTDKNKLNEYFTQRLQTQGFKTAKELCIGLLHDKIAAALLKASGIDADVLAGTVKESNWHRFLTLCKEFSTQITETNAYEQAQVCAGGVLLSEIHMETMESVLIPGLFFAGEIADADGICGGYNLQWAWATGFIAGNGAAKG